MKCTLMQIRKFHSMFEFAFLILIILESFTLKVYIFLKK